MGLTYDQLFPGRFIKAGEMHDKPVTLTISGVALDVLESEDGTEKMQAVVNFREIKRQWALNKTNAQCLVAMWGIDSDDWMGRRVTLFAERDASGLSDSGLCLRVKGSPDIDAPITVQVKLPRRRPIPRKLVPTTGAVVDDESGEVTDAAPQRHEDASETPREPRADAPDAPADAGPETDDFDGLEEPPAADLIDAMQTRALKNNMKRLAISTAEWGELLTQYDVASATSLSHEQAAELVATLQAQTKESWLKQRAMV